MEKLPRITRAVTGFLRERILENCFSNHLGSAYFTGLVPSKQLFKFSACRHFVGKFIIFIRSPDVVVRRCSIKIVGKQRQSPNLVKLPKNITSWNDIIIEIFQNFSKYFDCADQPNYKKREAEKLTYINGFTESE